MSAKTTTIRLLATLLLWQGTVSASEAQTRGQGATYQFNVRPSAFPDVVRFQVESSCRVRRMEVFLEGDAGDADSVELVGPGGDVRATFAPVMGHHFLPRAVGTDAKGEWEFVFGDAASFPPSRVDRAQVFLWCNDDRTPEEQPRDVFQVRSSRARARYFEQPWRSLELPQPRHVLPISVARNCSVSELRVQLDTQPAVDAAVLRAPAGQQWRVAFEGSSPISLHPIPLRVPEGLRSQGDWELEFLLENDMVVLEGILSIACQGASLGPLPAIDRTLLDVDERVERIARLSGRARARPSRSRDPGHSRPAVWGDAQGHVFVSNEHAVDWFDGTQWQRYAVDGIRAIAGSGFDRVYAVGVAGAVHRFDGQRWMAVPSGTSSHLNDVCVAEDGVWIAGDDNTVLHHDPTGWNAVPIRSAGGGNWTTVHCSSTGDLLVGGGARIIQRINGEFRSITPAMYFRRQDMPDGVVTGLAFDARSSDIVAIACFGAICGIAQRRQGDWLDIDYPIDDLDSDFGGANLLQSATGDIYVLSRRSIWHNGSLRTRANPSVLIRRIAIGGRFALSMEGRLLEFEASDPGGFRSSRLEGSRLP